MAWVLGYYGDKPLAVIYFLMFSPYIISNVTLCAKTCLFNLILCCVQIIFLSMEILKIFSVTLTEDQAYHIFVLLISAFSYIGLFALFSFAQKKLENSLWVVAQNHYIRYENLSKEAVKDAQGKDICVSSFSHEIRNSLNSLIGSVDLLLNIVKSTVHLKIVKNAKISCEIMLNLVNNILDAAKLQSDKLEVSYKDTNFEDIIKRALAVNSENLKAANIQTQISIDEKLPSLLRIDSGLILQVLLNLISNAIKFTQKGGKISINVGWLPFNQTKDFLLSKMRINSYYEDINKYDLDIGRLKLKTNSLILPSHSRSINSKLGTFTEFTDEEVENRLRSLKEKEFKVKHLTRLSSSFETDSWPIVRTPFTQTPSSSPFLYAQNKNILEESKGYLKVQISDTGCGIAQENLPKLFERFVQAHRGINSTYGGTGLGLWICKQICQKMGGEITAHSQINQGTDFVFYVPVDNTKRNGLSNNGSSIETNVTNALVVSNDSFDQGVYKLLLEKDGVHVTLCEDHKVAFDKYQEKGEGFFNFVLIDQPRLSNVQISEWKEATRRKKSNMYFILEGYKEENDALNYEFGSKDPEEMEFLHKPIDVEEIREIIEKTKMRKGKF